MRLDTGKGMEGVSGSGVRLPRRKTEKKVAEWRSSGELIERPGGERGMVVEGKWKREVRGFYRGLEGGL